MNDLRQYGVSVMTLSDVVDDFCLAQGNMLQTAILAQYRHARWSWKELFRTTLWNVRKAVVALDCRDNTIRLPADCDNLLAISVVDRFGILHPLGCNSDINTAQIRGTKVSCSCGTCGGQDTLCVAIDNIKVETETVVINGTDYTKTTWTRYDGAGAVQKQMKIPAWDTSSASVVYNTLTETICNVETTVNGCIKSSPRNIELLRNYCGAGVFIDQLTALGPFSEMAPPVYNYWGDFNFNAADKNIVHIFSSPRHFNHTDEEEAVWRGNIRQVVVDYKTNGETPQTEILIPEYAVEAIQMGIVYRQKYLHPKIGENEKKEAKYAWNAGKLTVAKYLNPIRLEAIRKMQSQQRAW